MILPGISGAFLLEVMGIYTPTLEALRGFEVTYVLTFAAGAAAGLGTFAKLLDWLLENRHDATMAALVGLIAGALRALWPYGGGERALRMPTAGEPVGSVVALSLAGLAAVLLLVWWGRRRVEPAATEADGGAPVG
jgi:putative membrane protein